MECATSVGEGCGQARLPPCQGEGSYGDGGVDGDADCGRGVDHVVHVPGAVGLLVDEVLLARARVGRDQMYRYGQMIKTVEGALRNLFQIALIYMKIIYNIFIEMSHYAGWLASFPL